eukprot:TRINITY_DN8550_c0_g1_i1.p1 TRINITY_DN8550_c0_g1~~TRINITY_DN8550_c0_g1_i1.p1  ORF type:complete len:346 (+),score=81.74 TRINITY_DN8550_c0_g1_i1:45-1082(+)
MNVPPVDPNTPCPVYQEFKFCSYGWDCQYKHGPLSDKDTNDLTNELIQVGHNHTQGNYQCLVCGAPQDPTNAVSAKVGETEAYPFCARCGNFYFYPHVQVVILKLLERAGTNYMEYKRLIDAHYRRLPAVLHVAFMYEAHRWATSRYAWSLTGPDNANEILDLVFKFKPQCNRMMSMGSGTGYIEHVFLHSSRDIGRELEIHAYDAMPQKKVGVEFDVPVKMGDVSSLTAHGDMSNTVLLLCWPPFGSKVREESRMAFDTVLKFTEQGGDFLVYIGDVNATGDWRYHDHLASHWELLKETFDLKKVDVWVPQQMGLIYAGNDTIGIYRKRDVPLKIEPPQWTVTA